MNKLQFTEKLLAWYAHHHRNLPWRNTTDPYKIWLSEIILQQTRVAQGLPYYKKFIEHFPTVLHLARATEQEVLRLWQGLGYYSRARNMHHTAQYLATQRQGRFPETYAELLQLKGIGTYTAAAIASFAFREKVAVLDGNVFRVLSRLFGIETDIASPEAKKVFSKLANELIDEAQPDTFNQALMEFGALQCQPVSPDCLLCPFQENCVACQTGRQAGFPVKSKKAPVKERFFQYIVFRFAGKTALRQRPGKDIWQGLHDFYLLESVGFQPIEVLADEKIKQLLALSEVWESEEIFTHQLTHRRIFAKFLEVRLPEEERFCEDLEKEYGLQFYSPAAVEALPKPVLISRFLEKYS